MLKAKRYFFSYQVIGKVSVKKVSKQAGEVWLVFNTSAQFIVRWFLEL